MGLANQYGSARRNVLPFCIRGPVLLESSQKIQYNSSLAGESTGVLFPLYTQLCWYCRRRFGVMWSVEWISNLGPVGTMHSPTRLRLHREVLCPERRRYAPATLLARTGPNRAQMLYLHWIHPASSVGACLGYRSVIQEAGVQSQGGMHSNHIRPAILGHSRRRQLSGVYPWRTGVVHPW